MGLARTAVGAGYNVINVFAGAGAAAGNELTISNQITTGSTNSGFVVTKIGAGTLTFAGTTANTYTEPTVVDEGTLVLGKTAAVNAMTGVLVVGTFGNAATVKLGNTGSSNFNQFSTAEPIIVNASGTLDISGSTAATTQTITTLDVRGGTVKTGTNTLSLNNTITGLAANTTGTTAVSGTISGNLTMTANITVNTADVGTTPGLAISALISGAFTLTKGGQGTLLLDGTAANTYSGVTTVNSGTLQLVDTGGLAIAGSLVIGDSLGGASANKADVVRLLASNQIAPTAVVTINDSGLLDLNNFNNTIGVGATNALILTGGSVTTETGTLTLGGNVSGVASLPNLTPATINGNLSLGGATRTFDVQPGALTGSNTNDMVINAVISNGGVNAGLTKNDTGKLQLTGNNTYTGATTANAGQLLVDGSQPNGAVTVNTGAVLGGTGTIGTITTLGGTVNPGDPSSSVATLTANTTNLSGGALTVQVSGSNTPTGGNHLSSDLLNLGSSSLTLGGSSTLTLDLSGLTTSTGGPLTIIEDGGNSSTFTTVNVINNPNNFTANIAYLANSVVVTIAAPATQLVFGTQPSDTTAGMAINTGTGVAVKIEDAFGNVETTDNTSTLSIAIATGPTGGLFNGSSTTTVNVVGGVATFNNLFLNTAGSYTLQASDASPVLTSAASNSFVVSAAAASQLVITQQPSATATAGVNFATQPVVKEEDQFGNVITTDSTHTVTVATGNHGTGTLQGSTLTVTLSNGVATFSGLSYNVAETMNLAFTTNAGGFTATSTDVVVSRGEPRANSLSRSNRRVQPRPGCSLRRSRWSRRKTASATSSPPTTRTR